MPTLPTTPLPLPLDGPPREFAYDQRSISQRSTSTDFNDRMNERDSWNGKWARCVVCGMESVCKACYIFPQSEDDEMWAELKRRNYIPQAAKSTMHEPRNALSMCPNHAALFNRHLCFIRFLPQERKYVYINYIRSSSDKRHHGKAVNLNANDRHAPFPAALLVHEQRVRGDNPFSMEPNDIPTTIQFQDWMTEDDNDTSATGGNTVNFVTENQASGNSSEEPAPSGTFLSTLDKGTVEAIIAATRKSETWKACVIEGTSWDGTAEENAQKYKKLLDEL